MPYAHLRSPLIELCCLLAAHCRRGPTMRLPNPIGRSWRLEPETTADTCRTYSFLRNPNTQILINDINSSAAWSLWLWREFFNDRGLGRQVSLVAFDACKPPISDACKAAVSSCGGFGNIVSEGVRAAKRRFENRRAHPRARRPAICCFSSATTLTGCGSRCRTVRDCADAIGPHRPRRSNRPDRSNLPDRSNRANRVE